jgi:CRP-like cAMP-binding protein
MKSLADLRAYADARLLSGEFAAALHAYAALVRLDPTELSVRLRLGDALLALGRPQEAALVYAALARHATHAGHPLHALLAMKILEALDPQLGALLGGLAKLYAQGSPKLGPAVRLSLGLGDGPLPPGFAPSERPNVDELVPVAAQIGASYEGVAAYAERVPPIPLFSQLPEGAFAAVLAALKLVRARPGDAILRQGEPGQAFYVLARGTVRVLREGEGAPALTLATLHSGSIFGEMALVSAQPRTATVVAVTDCDLLEFDRDALLAASGSVGAIAAALDAFARERLVNNLLATAPLFSPLDKKQRLELARRFAALDVAARTPILTEGQPGQGLYVLLSGEAEVWKRDGAEKVLLATLKPGDVFGEISLVRDEPTTASVTAATQCTVLFLAKDLFERLARAIPAIATYVEELGDERVMDTRILLRDAAAAEPLGDDDLVFI